MDKNIFMKQLVLRNREIAEENDKYIIVRNGGKSRKIYKSQIEKIENVGVFNDDNHSDA